MAKKKPKLDTPKSKRRGPPPPAGLPSRRAMAGVRRQLAADLQGAPTPDTPLTWAQNLIDEAFDEPNPQRRVTLAHEALRLCPDCADAHILLAEHAPTRKLTLAHYERGVAAGERAIGPDAFQSSVGHFWSVLETRPYMRARLGLAHALWTRAKHDEAVRHLQDMLRLNPGDNQGVRYALAGWLLFLDRDAELVQLLDQYADDASAAWDYTKALFAFRQHGDTPDARKRLKHAIKTNRHVPAYLLGTKFPPAAQPDSYSPGDQSEALEYVGGFLTGWKSTPGAVAWLRATTAKPKLKLHTKGPGVAVKKLLAKLPQADDVWQCDFRPLPNWMMVAGEPIRPWAVLVTSRTHDLVLAHRVTDEPPTPALVWDVLAEALRKRTSGPAHRPTTLQMHAGECGEGLRSHLEEIGIGLEIAEQLDQFDAVFASLSQSIGGEVRPGLLDAPGMTPDRVRGFYDAAAGFFRQAPWKRIGFEGAIKVTCDRLKGGPWYAVVMGQSGLTTGLALYEDLGVLRQMWGGAGDADDPDDEANARATVATSVTFNEPWDIATADLDAATAHGWPVARPDAYPEVSHKERGMSMRSPLPWELELLEGCLRAVPEFVGRREQDDPAREAFTVPAAGGSLKLVLSWVVEDDTEAPRQAT